MREYKKETIIALKILFFFLEGGDVIQRKLTKKLLQTHNIYIQKNIFFPIMLAGKEISPLPPE